MLRMASRKLGTVPVVSAFSRGRVTVGADARAVNGRAWLVSIKLKFPKE